MTRKDPILIVLALLFSLSGIHAQSPGGVSTNLSLWMEADSATSVSSTNTNISTWKDQKKINTFSISGSASTITVIKNAVNFHSIVRFAGSATLQGNTSIQWSECSAVVCFNGDPLSERGTMISPQTSGTQSNDASRYYFRSAGDGNGVIYAGMGKDSIGFEYIQATPDGQTNLLTASGVGNVFNRNGIDARIGSLYGGFTARDTIMNSGPQIGDRSTDDSKLKGDIAEIIVYSLNNAANRNKVESYLALKYGISMGTFASPVNYTSSNGTVFWNENPTYQHNIFGIGNDPGSNLNQPKSNSINSGSGTGAGRSGMGNLLLNFLTGLTAQQFLMIGTDSLPLSEEKITNTIGPAVATNSWRLNRNWKVRNTGSVGNVRLSFDITGLTTRGGTTASNYWLVIDRDGDGNFTTGTMTYYNATSTASNQVLFPNVTLPDNAVFTIITSPASGVVLSTDWLDFTTSVKQTTVSLSWAVPQDENILHYDIERSTNTTDFIRVGSQAARQSADISKYAYNDQPGPGNYYYRIRAVDMDGNATFSPVHPVTLTGKEFLHLKSNPITGGRLQLDLDVPASCTLSLRIADRQGKAVVQRHYSLYQGSNTVNIDLSNYPPGLYFVQAETGTLSKTLSFLK